MKSTVGRPFKKGQSGNPGGRPRTAELAKAIRTYLDAPIPGNRRKTRLEGLIERLYQKDPKTLLAYGYGKPIEIREPTGQTVEEGDSPKPTLEQVRRWIAEDEAVLGKTFQS